ncbi:MAG: cell division protein FtsQ, partial [Mycobacterium sp.]|nr:cell division protein FtsQ [Mycobacterium sp.]
MTVDDGSGQPQAEPDPAQAQDDTAPDEVTGNATDAARDEAAPDATEDAAPVDPASADYEGPRRRAR